MNKNLLPKDIVGQVTTEVKASYSNDELLAFPSFAKLWETVDAQNGYEDEWKAWKAKGIKSTYRKVFYQLREALS